MAFRLICYMVQLWKAQAREFEKEKRPASQWRLSPVIPVVLYTGKRRWPQPLSLQAIMLLPNALQGLAKALQEVAASLDDLPSEALAAIRKTLAVLYLLIRHKREAQEQEDLFAILEEAVERHGSEREEAKMTGAELLTRK